MIYIYKIYKNLFTYLIQPNSVHYAGGPFGGAGGPFGGGGGTGGGGGFGAGGSGAGGYRGGPQIPILRYDNNPNQGDGSYNYQYETANGISARERGFLKGI
ncbi:hypothetical protein NQ314_010521 [Rhamnusium bicolor]|uniref:Uncharacterized protein n=1 Tax=Rhamnusium bicolor TaxID=1586634 RepID=A0AAV8XRA4_9CUCU|nr:hypothetical protein NQ314_010521 [Rhamnusium bicolor]